LLNAKVGIFSLSYAVMPSFLVSVLFIDLYFMFKFNILVIKENGTNSVYPWLPHPLIIKFLLSLYI